MYTQLSCHGGSGGRVLTNTLENGVCRFETRPRQLSAFSLKITIII